MDEHPRICRTLDETWAAGLADAAEDPPLSQATADRVAVILAPYFRLRHAEAEDPAAG